MAFMNDCDKEIVDDKLTQADLIKLMLHNAQHMATREEVKSDILKLETNIQGVRTELKSDIQELKADINKISLKFDRIQWLIISTIVAVLLKEQIIGLFTS